MIRTLILSITLFTLCNSYTFDNPMPESFGSIVLAQNSECMQDCRDTWAEKKRRCDEVWEYGSDSHKQCRADANSWREICEANCDF